MSCIYEALTFIFFLPHKDQQNLFLFNCIYIHNWRGITLYLRSIYFHFSHTRISLIYSYLIIFIFYYDNLQVPSAPPQFHPSPKWFSYYLSLYTRRLSKFYDDCVNDEDYKILAAMRVVTLKPLKTTFRS